MLSILTIQKKCKTELHGIGKGEWAICADSKFLLNDKSIVYSIGIGDNISFDLSLIDKYGVCVHGFDPTPFSIEWVNNSKLPAKFNFHPFGVADKDETVTIYPPSSIDLRSYSIIPRISARRDIKPVNVPMHRLPTIMKMLGHTKIDILKMDIEGAEYRVIDDMIASKIYPTQLIIEFHHHIHPLTPQDTLDSVSMLNKYGYDISWMSLRKREFSFIANNHLLERLVKK